MKVAFIADIHEDIVNLKKSLSLIKQKGIEIIICLGDMTGYGRESYDYTGTKNASGCIDLIQKNCSFSVAGNHDYFVLKKIPQSFPIFPYPHDWYELDFAKRKELAGGVLWLYEDTASRTILNKRQKNYLNSLPEFSVVTVNDLQFLISHFIFPDLTGSKIGFPDTLEDLSPHFEFMRQNRVDLSFSGHGHAPGAYISDNHKIKLVNYGKIQLTKNSATWVSGPCLARNKSSSGIMIFDPQSFELEIISI